MREELTDDVLDRVAFIGETLGPFYLEDPVKGNAGNLFAAFQALDVSAAAAEWPFVDEAQAESALAMMHEGLAAGSDDEDLMWEYRRLFIGPGEKPAPPWGSVYTDRECVIFGAATLELRQWMREQGIERHMSGDEPEDHIGFMLLLMAWISRHRPEALEDFLRIHMLTWTSHFLDELSEAARHPFYEGLAILTKESLEGVQSALSIDVVYPRFYR